MKKIIHATLITIPGVFTIGCGIKLAVGFFRERVEV